MLDVHAPERGIGNAREFFLHLFTITCGLLIALALENAAEFLHHRYERGEATESIRREMEENRSGAVKAVPVLLLQRKQLSALLAIVEAHSEGKVATLPAGTEYPFSEQEIPDAAWRTASSTGVLAYMDYAEVERYAAAYREQDLLQKQEQQALDDYLQLGAYVPRGANATSFTPERAKLALPFLRRCLADLDGILAIGKGTVSAYNEALK